MKTPYFINPAVEALPTATGEERTALIRLIAANVGDEATLRALTGIDPAEFADFYPDMKPPRLSTEATIDTFISRFSSERAADAPEIEEIIASPAIDYASLIESEEDTTETANPDAVDTEPDATADAISAFLNAVPPKTTSPRRTPRMPQAKKKEEMSTAPAAKESHPELSEALFRLMVKNKNYRKALEIIKELSLNNPKKSIYFAYQIRFLEKLIKNQENMAPTEPASHGK